MCLGHTRFWVGGTGTARPHPGAPPALLRSFRATCYSDIKNGLRSHVLTGAGPEVCVHGLAATQSASACPAALAPPRPRPATAPPAGGPVRTSSPVLRCLSVACLRMTATLPLHSSGSGSGGHHPAVGRGMSWTPVVGARPGQASSPGKDARPQPRHRPPPPRSDGGRGAAGGRAWAAWPPRGCARAGDGPRAELAGRS